MKSGLERKINLNWSEKCEPALKRFMSGENELILGIESSCDETAAAVLCGGRKVLSMAVHTQIPVHRLYGGVVPEIASRSHTERIGAVADEALKSAGVGLNDIGAIAVTCTPGLIGALLVGVSYAKGLAYAANIPLVGVNHIAGISPQTISLIRILNRRLSALWLPAGTAISFAWSITIALSLSAERAMMRRVKLLTRRRVRSACRTPAARR